MAKASKKPRRKKKKNLLTWRTVSMSKETLRRIEKISRDTGISVPRLCRELIQNILNNITDAEWRFLELMAELLNKKVCKK